MRSIRGLCHAVPLVIVVLSFLSTSAVNAKDAHSPDTLLQKKLLSAEEATFIAVLPGFLFHGLGHFYAKDQTTGVVLLLTEAVGLFFINNALRNGFSENQFAQRGNGYDIPIGLVAFLVRGSTILRRLQALLKDTIGKLL